MREGLPAVFGSDKAIVGLDFELHRRRKIHLQAAADRLLRCRTARRSERGDALSRPQRFLHQLAGLAELFTRPKRVLPPRKMRGLPE